MHFRPLFHLIFLLLTLFLYIILGQSGDLRSEIEKYWLLITPIFLSYFLITYHTMKSKGQENMQFYWYVIFGLLFRLALMPTEPFLSDDIYRYLWDGKIFIAGINPYKYAPADIHLQEFRDQVVYPLINFPDIASSYPPVAQIIFLINELLGGSVLSWKILVFAIEIVLFLILLKLRKQYGLNKLRLLIYFYNPLLIIETYSSGHLEIVGVFFFWMAVYHFYKRSEWKSILSFAISIMTKFFPLISTIPFLFNRLIRKSALLLILCSILLLPFGLNGILPLPGLFSYVNRWEFNGGLFQLSIYILDLLNIREYHWMAINFSGFLETFYFNYAFYYKICAAFFFVILCFDQLNKLRSTSDFRSINFVQRSFILTAGFLLLTPTLHPWYIIWIIPFLIFIPNWSWLIFTFLIQSSYFVLKDYALSSLWQESVWILLFQYIPFYILLIWEYLDRRKVKGWFVA